eukprot:s2040_g4.t1
MEGERENDNAENEVEDAKVEDDNVEKEDDDDSEDDSVEEEDEKNENDAEDEVEDDDVAEDEDQLRTKTKVHIFVRVWAGETHTDIMSLCEKRHFLREFAGKRHRPRGEHDPGADFVRANALRMCLVSRRNGVRFFNIATFKSGPNVRCF